MKYITGIYALNLPCALLTTGDWHTSALNWEKVKYKESEKTVLGDYGIEYDKNIPEHIGKYNVANHIRAILDIMEDGDVSLISNFKNDYICNDEYTNEIFTKVYLLLPNEQINNLMHKTYGKEWRIWIGKKNMEKY